jgi:hypothetical protein
MPAEQLAELARDYFGEDRVQVAERLDEAIDIAVSLADDADAAGLPGSSAVLITGSVVTAGDAQLLLAPASAVGTSVNAGYARRAAQYGSPAQQGPNEGELP